MALVGTLIKSIGLVSGAKTPIGTVAMHTPHVFNSLFDVGRPGLDSEESGQENCCCHIERLQLEEGFTN